ncbi:hypothetical protein QVD17_20722 [Tagetes erecta]|uniref:Uncharacterized protein n=1 Tax=Tagetes erecta TaxID=13708 RepID=A0AAD8NYH0_TARER|nr:hypothetical protein QVD17_20722 [Tagetes erecta]
MVPSSASILHACFLLLFWSDRLYANVNECYSSIISFGDSIADTGNLKKLDSISDVWFPCPTPYGQNFIGQTTGRCTNGRLIIDFLAESLGLPLVQPYLRAKGSGGGASLRQGVNYAVVGATALDSSFLEAKWHNYPMVNTSLEVQLSWFKQSLPSICGNTSDCRNFIGRSLILLGHIGGNDYNLPFSEGKKIDEIKPYVTLVIKVIISVLNELIAMGARSLVVPGNFPVGCFPSVLTVYESHNEEYDPITGCLTKFNEFAEYHNTMLQAKLNQIRELNPNVVIMYADYYNSLMQIYNSPHEYGFTKKGTLNACCGCGEQYNFNMTRICGGECFNICDEPDTYVSWDGMHFTEATYKSMFKSLFQGPYITPEFYSQCPTKPISQVGITLSKSI